MMKKIVPLVSLCLSVQLLAFDSYEHIATGTMGVKLKFPDDQQVYEDFPYKTYYEILMDKKNSSKVGKIFYTPQYLSVRDKDGGALKLSYGEIIAIGGDFAGDSTQPISSGIEFKNFEAAQDIVEENFMRHFNALVPFKSNPIYLNNNLEYLRGLFKEEYKHLLLAMNKKHGVHFNSASSHSVTSKIKDQWAYSKSPGYTELLTANIDHFADEGKISYAAGHSLALRKAKKGFDLAAKGDKEGALDALNTAYAMDAFAAHFLTDHFSAGHIRTPRGPLLDVSKKTKYRAAGYTAANVGLMANAMHDEDNYIGLWLKNGEGQVWKAFGDGSYFDVKSEDNREAIRDALQASVDEVWDAFKKGTVVRFKSFKALKLVGVPLESGNDFIKSIVNPFPLFRMGESWPEVRKNYYDNAVSEYQNITAMTGISSFIKSDIGTYNHNNFLSFLNEAHLVETMKRDVIIECYNYFDRDSIWPSKSKDYVALGETVNVVFVDNSELQFYQNILKGGLRPDGIFYVVNEDAGARILDQCKHTMQTSFKLGEASKPDVVEIRGRIERGYTHPMVVFDKDGNLRRLLGYKNLQ